MSQPQRFRHIFRGQARQIFLVHALATPNRRLTLSGEKRGHWVLKRLLVSEKNRHEEENNRLPEGRARGKKTYYMTVPTQPSECIGPKFEIDRDSQIQMTTSTIQSSRFNLVNLYEFKA